MQVPTAACRHRFLAALSATAADPTRHQPRIQSYQGEDALRAAASPFLSMYGSSSREDAQDLLPLEPAVAEVPVLDTADAASVELNVAGAATAYCGFSTDVRLE